MSLIQEALQRKKGEAPETPAAGPAPENPAGPPALPGKMPVKRPGWIVLLASSLVMILLIGVALFLLFKALSPGKPGQPAAAPTAAVQRVATAMSAPVATGAVAKAAALPTGSFVSGIRSNVLTSLKKVHDNAENTNQVTTNAPATTPTDLSATTQPAVVPPVAPKNKEQSKVRWPTLRVSAVIAHANPELGRALINGRMTRVGEEIEGVQLAGVTGSGIYVAAQNQTNFIRIGRASAP